MTPPESSAAPIITLEVRTEPPYPVMVGPGASRRLATWLIERRLAARYALVADSNVAALHVRPLHDLLVDAGLSVGTIVFAAGEANKTRATKEIVEDAMIDAGCGRDAAIVAVGGGVTTDLAGFVAATYQRGIRCVQVPTSLLAMVDASVGGKTGVDHAKGKNLIGAFHQPSAVFIDTDFLFTLPEREYRSGLAEIVKTAVIRDAALFDRISGESEALLRREPGLLTEVIARSCEIKAEVVAADEKEGDLRKILNLGHTIGHAIETLSGYELTHGEAVSIGMVAETRMAQRLGVLPAAAAEAVERTLENLGLPVSLSADRPALRPWSILEVARRDKKARDGRIAYVLPSALGVMARGPAGYGILLEDALAAEVLAGMLDTAPPR
jgi:3-dehydroquinate synthase